MKPGPKVLLVADDDEFRSSTARLLTGRGFSCIEATHDVEARAAFDVDPGVVAVLWDIDPVFELTGAMRFRGCCLVRRGSGPEIEAWPARQVSVRVCGVVR